MLATAPVPDFQARPRHSNQWVSALPTGDMGSAVPLLWAVHEGPAPLCSPDQGRVSPCCASRRTRT